MNTSEEIKNSGLKATTPRTKILQLFQQAQDRHMSADDVFSLLRNRGSDIGLATVYRVLMQFEQAGILYRNQFEGGRAFFELADIDPHDHIVCLDCQHVLEFCDPTIESQQNHIAENAGFRIADHSLILYAHCIKERCENRDAFERRNALT